MSHFKLWPLIIAFIITVFAGTAYAAHFLIVEEDGPPSIYIEAGLTAAGHTYSGIDRLSALTLTPNDVLTTYDATFFMGLPSSTPDTEAWLIALMDAGVNVLVADHDFGRNRGSYPLYTEYFEATYVSDSGSYGVLTGQGIMAGINPDISAGLFPDDFTIAGTNGTIIFIAPSGNAAGTAIEKTPASGNTYRGIYLSWDYDDTSSGELYPLTAAIAEYLTNSGSLPPIAAIPTLSEWGMIVMSLILAGSAFWMIRRRKLS